MIKLGKLSFLSILFVVFSLPASATVINIIQPAATPGSWSNAYPGSPGSLGIVDLTGEGGDLENNVTLGPGALRMETTGDGSSRSEVVLVDGGGVDLGTVGDFITGGSVSYDYYQTSGAPNPNITPGFKITVLDSTDVNGDGYASFIFEPVYNGGVGAFDTWHTVGFGGSEDGIGLWHTGIYGDAGFNNFYDEYSMADWNALFNGTLFDAVIVAISVGIGSGTPSQLGFVDNINFTNGINTYMADFELAQVPLPAALPLYATGLALFGFAGMRKRRKNKE